MKKPIALHSASSEAVRRIRSALRTHETARAESRKLAVLMWAYRHAGIKPAKEGPIYRRYSEARSRLSLTGRLLNVLRKRHKKLHGTPYVEKRRNIAKEMGRRSVLGSVHMEG